MCIGDDRVLSHLISRALWKHEDGRMSELTCETPNVTIVRVCVCVCVLHKYTCGCVTHICTLKYCVIWAFFSLTRFQTSYGTSHVPCNKFADSFNSMWRIKQISAKHINVQFKSILLSGFPCVCTHRRILHAHTFYHRARPTLHQVLILVVVILALKAPRLVLHHHFDFFLRCALESPNVECAHPSGNHGCCGVRNSHARFEEERQPQASRHIPSYLHL